MTQLPYQKLLSRGQISLGVLLSFV